MSEIPAELRYTDSHEWIREEGGGIVSVGITDYAQEALGDVVYVELPEVGDVINTGDEAGLVESVKAASDIFAPVSGTVVAVNEELADAPQIINSSPYGDGWFFKIKLADPDEFDELLDADAYQEVLDSEED